jgi:hypothetical protein
MIFYKDSSSNGLPLTLLTFTPTGPSPQTVTITGVQDGVQDGPAARDF